MRLEQWLPALNTALIAISGVAVLTGYAFIRRRRVTAHRRAMITAAVFAALFLVVYAIRWALLGSKPFAGEGWLRGVYLATLVTHVILATALAPMVLVTLRRALAGQYASHRRIARKTLPVWLYVAASGWAVYAMLYCLPQGYGR
ncbi:MAG: DUF420 domain-containing protein [Armatimonadota bacterium]|nr:DUF420 domain-containing protein [Armatimonadota bacterium]MDR5698021.1 DUF420 domain-containing protein [Armatimonadota bacterium]